MRLAKPLYEGLPWIYGLGGAALLFISYRLHAGTLSSVCALLGLAGLIAGGAVWLRRRDYRESHTQYTLRTSPPPGPGAAESERSTEQR